MDPIDDKANARVFTIRRIFRASLYAVGIPCYCIALILLRYGISKNVHQCRADFTFMIKMCFAFVGVLLLSFILLAVRDIIVVFGPVPPEKPIRWKRMKEKNTTDHEDSPIET